MNVELQAIHDGLLYLSVANRHGKRLRELVLLVLFLP